MESLVVLEKALLEEDRIEVKGYLDTLDRKTSNELMRKVCAHFGLPVADALGISWTHMGMLAEFFGYADVSGLWKLVEAYQLEARNIGWFGAEVKTSLRETFKLSPKDSRAVFITWDTFLVAGMHGTTQGAKRVKIYLLDAERAFRVGIATNGDLKAIRAATMVYDLEAKKAKDKVALAARIDRMKDGPFKDAAITALEGLTGCTFPRSKQQSLGFDNSNA